MHLLKQIHWLQPTLLSNHAIFNKKSVAVHVSSTLSNVGLDKWAQCFGSSVWPGASVSTPNSPVILLQPKKWLHHPGLLLHLLRTKMFTGSKYPKIFYLLLKTRSLVFAYSRRKLKWVPLNPECSSALVTTCVNRFEYHVKPRSGDCCHTYIST